MPFKPGQGGRQPGAINRRSRAFIELLEAKGFCPASAMIECFENAKKTYDNYGVIYEAISEARGADQDKTGTFHAPLQDEAHKYLKIAADIAKDLATYAYPKLKAVEVQETGALESMSPEQRLEAMRYAVAALELQIKKENGS